MVSYSRGSRVCSVLLHVEVRQFSYKVGGISFCTTLYRSKAPNWSTVGHGNKGEESCNVILQNRTFFLHLRDRSGLNLFLSLGLESCLPVSSHLVCGFVVNTTLSIRIADFNLLFWYNSALFAVFPTLFPQFLFTGHQALPTPLLGGRKLFYLGLSRNFPFSWVPKVYHPPKNSYFSRDFLSQFIYPDWLCGIQW